MVIEVKNSALATRHVYSCMFEAHLIVKTILKTLDEWTWPAPEDGTPPEEDMPSTYFNGISAVRNGTACESWYGCPVRQHEEQTLELEGPHASCDLRVPEICYLLESF